MPDSGQGDGKAYSGVVKDPLDLRGLMYESGLFELPFKLDNRKKVPVVLDQGTEGACTGFGLAAVVNFLHHNRGDFSAAQKAKYEKKENGASARMLYEMARRYDEWQGENYDGSSVRGAMKGWAKHGVCTWGQWPYNANDPGRLTPSRQFDALRHTLGAYFRVRHLHLNQMQAALKEAGILYASASVHEGWRRVGGDGIIRYSPRLIGGHAFAIVGYDDRGFWVQNSWGPRWGNKGFCHLGYDDWLENGYDCWVARLGVPVLALPEDARDRIHGRAAEFGYIADEAVELNDIRPHFVNLGNDGRFSQSGRYSNDPDDVDEVVLKGFKNTAASWSGPRKLAIYCHGGLNSGEGLDLAHRIAPALFPRQPDLSAAFHVGDGSPGVHSRHRAGRLPPWPFPGLGRQDEGTLLRPARRGRRTGRPAPRQAAVEPDEGQRQPRLGGRRGRRPLHRRAH